MDQLTMHTYQVYKYKNCSAYIHTSKTVITQKLFRQNMHQLTAKNSHCQAPSKQQLKAQNKLQYLHRKSQILPYLPPINYTHSPTEQLAIKYQGYLRIYNKKNRGEPTQYFQSPFLRQIIRSKNVQFSADSIDKFTKIHGIDQYACNLNVGPSKVSTISELSHRLTHRH